MSVKVNPRTVIKLAPQGMAAGSALWSLRKARRSGDTLEFLDAVVATLGVVTGLLLVLRQLRRERLDKAERQAEKEWAESEAPAR